MRNYTYIDGTRFLVANLFRSLRFDIDRLDMSWVADQKPVFSRGFRIVDNDEGNTVTVDGEDADNLIYSLTYIYCKEDNSEDFRVAVDTFLKTALEEKDYLVSNQQKKSEEAVHVTEPLSFMIGVILWAECRCPYCCNILNLQVPFLRQT